MLWNVSGISVQIDSKVFASKKRSGKPKGLSGYCSRCGMHMYPSITVNVQLYISLCMTELDFGKAWVKYNLQILDQAIEEKICPEMSIKYLFIYLFLS